MNNKFSVAIVGGGFSALVLACSLDRSLQKNSIIFEKLSRVGKKILSTGNGRGNFTNEFLSLNCYHGGDVSFAAYALKKYDNQVIRGFFEKRGVLSATENGRVYPMSFQANSLLDGLRLSHSAAVLESAEVTDISKNDSGFELKTKLGTFYADTVVIAAGGMAAKNFGTDGDSYRLASRFGHKSSETYPSLVQMRAEKSDIKGLKGVKHDAQVSLYDGDKFIKSANGDLLFTDYGVSGNSVFYLSSYLAGISKPRLEIDFIRDCNVTALFNSLSSRAKEFADKGAEFLLSGVVHSAIALKVARERLGDKKLGDLGARDINSAIEAIENYRVTIIGTLGFDNAQVTRGGILTKDVDPITMESKLEKGLYFCGEALDIDGDCGGYNLQWAFSSAKCAAEAINERFDKR